MAWSENNHQPLNGKLAIVTGANAGIGFEVTKVLSGFGMEVIMACRDLSRAEDSKRKIIEENPQANLDCYQLDLGDLGRVMDFAEEITKNHSKLDLLINNGGLMMPPHQLTVNGFESQFGVNYLGHFALTGRLLPLLEKALSARVVTVSSLAHKWGEIYFKNLQLSKVYDRRKAYGQSKLACLIFAYELQRRLENKGSSVRSLAAHPGVAYSNLVRYLPSVIGLIERLFMQTSFEGAQPVLRAALDPNAKGGEYYGPGGFRQMSGEPVLVDSSEDSKDQEIASKLWEISEKLSGVKYLSKEAVLS